MEEWPSLLCFVNPPSFHSDTIQTLLRLSSIEILNMDHYFTVFVDSKVFVRGACIAENPITALLS